MKNKEINYKVVGRYILLKTKDMTDTGLILPSNIKQTNMALEVVAVAEGINHIKVGDMVIAPGEVMAWTIDDKNYYQVHESNVVGIVLNNGKVLPTPQDNFPEKDPTAHYNQK